jgi:hypothetical protein
VSVAVPVLPPVVDDEVVLGWWESYDAGREPRDIAWDAGVEPKIVTRELDALGVIEDPILRRARFGRSTDDELAIMASLARINDHDLPRQQREVQWAQSMQHTLPNKRAAVVQSARQRRQDRMGGKWRAIVRADLRRAGLIP